MYFVENRNIFFLASRDLRYKLVSQNLKSLAQYV